MRNDVATPHNNRWQPADYSTDTRRADAAAAQLATQYSEVTRGLSYGGV